MLHVSTDWLLSGEGKEPIPTGMVPPRLPYLVEKGDDPKEPFNVETLQSVSVAVQLVYSAAQEDPTASPLELLLRAQIAALKQHK